MQCCSVSTMNAALFGYVTKIMNIVILEILQSDWAALLSAAVQILYKHVPRPPTGAGLRPATQYSPPSTANYLLRKLSS